MLPTEKTGCLNGVYSRPTRHRYRLRVPGLILMLIVLLPIAAPAKAGLLHNQDRDRSTISPAVKSAGDGAAQKLARGKLLVASRRLGDPNFRKTVILLVRYGPDGAMGLVINRPLAVKLATILPDIKELAQSTEPLYIGGPVEPTAVLLLVKSLEQPEFATAVIEDVYLTSNAETLRQLIKKGDKSERFRIFAGYAGWAPQQLESECSRGDWFVLDADHKTLFDRKSAEIWPELIQHAAVKWVRFKTRDHTEIKGLNRLPGTKLSLRHDD